MPRPPKTAGLCTMRAKLAACLIGFGVAAPVQACTTALLLAIDVSNSIDAGEYRIQADGLADALLDPEVREALVAGNVALSVMQWSGRGSQQITFPWEKMLTDADVLRWSEMARTMPRAFIMSDTAVGDMIRFSMDHFRSAPDCDRRVIDVSGDGTDNAGTDPQGARSRAENAGITINALASEGMGVSITTFFRRHVITRDGFVMTSRGHESYAETLKRKIRREVSQIMF